MKLLRPLFLLTLPALLALAMTAVAAETPAPATSAPAAAVKPSSEKWEAEVKAYEDKDKQWPPAAGGVLFIGSSSIRKWTTLKNDFPSMKVIGRGVGGCQMVDVLYYADRLILPYKPKQIVIYAGDNDISSGRPGEAVVADLKALVEKVQKALPQTRILVLSVKPSPKRAPILAKCLATNVLLREFCEKTPGTVYVDTATCLLGADGKPKPEFFLDDRLHLNRLGYEQWIPIVKAALEKAPAAAKP